MSENRRSADGGRHDLFVSLSLEGKEGDWWFDAAHENIFIWIPGGGVTRWPIDCEPGEHPCWKWDGNLDAPTLTPSLWLVGTWHGWMREGKLVSV
jgi:hypothetical protein